MLDCPERFYEDNDGGECLLCHPDCALCDGPDNTDCDACTDPKATLHNEACVVACSPHTYRDTTTGECEGMTEYIQRKFLPISEFGYVRFDMLDCREDHRRTKYASLIKTNLKHIFLFTLSDCIFFLFGLFFILYIQDSCAFRFDNLSDALFLLTLCSLLTAATFSVL